MFREMCTRSTWHGVRSYVENVVHICAYLCKSCYVCYLPYLPSPIPTPPNPSAGGDVSGGWVGGAGVGWGGAGAWEVGEVADVARLA